MEPPTTDEKQLTNDLVIRDFWLQSSNLRQNLSMWKDQLKSLGVLIAGRELSMGHTKLQEAELWLKEAYEVFTNQLPQSLPQEENK